MRQVTARAKRRDQSDLNVMKPPSLRRCMSCLVVAAVMPRWHGPEASQAANFIRENLSSFAAISSALVTVCTAELDPAAAGVRPQLGDIACAICALGDHLPAVNHAVAIVVIGQRARGASADGDRGFHKGKRAIRIGARTRWNEFLIPNFD